MDARFNAVDKRFEDMNSRFDDMKELLRSEIKRLEERLSPIHRAWRHSNIFNCSFSPGFGFAGRRNGLPTTPST